MESEVALISQPDIPLGPSQMIKMTVRKVVKVKLRKDDKLQKMLQMMPSQLLWPRVRLWHPILEGNGPHPSTNLAGEVSKMQSNAGEVSKMQRQIAELEARLAEKESKVTDDL